MLGNFSTQDIYFTQFEQLREIGIICYHLVGTAVGYGRYLSQGIQHSCVTEPRCKLEPICPLKPRCSHSPGSGQRADATVESRQSTQQCEQDTRWNMKGK